MKLVMVRHGEYKNDHLTVEGLQQADALAKILLQHAQGKRVRVMTSPLERAVETAVIIAKAYDCGDPTRHDMLFDGIIHPFSGHDLMGFVPKQIGEVDVLILVTHEPACEHFPPMLGQMWGFDIEQIKLKKGQTRIIDRETRTTCVF